MADTDREKKNFLPMTVIVIIEVIMCLYLWNFAD